eukprot:TRINITY_DN18497_c0_g1_i3.p1 TRINITY_DN18497_c0_g1~~TRINITY_DN18497_c0_g1_i3.p1  ORF type:complete len:362 (+),score=51.46 TRINITY_DN18497_c0_g1_i3:558-1643(+)
MRDYRETLSALLLVMDARCTVELIDAVPVEKLAVVLKAPADNVTAVLTNIRSHNFSQTLISLLQEPELVLAEKIVPLICAVSRPKHLALAVSHADLTPLLWVVRGARTQQLAIFIDAVQEEDYGPGGAVIAFIKAIRSEPDLVHEKILPVMNSGDAMKLATLIQGVWAKKLMDIMRRLSVEETLFLLENSRAEDLVNLCNGPLEGVIGWGASRFANAMRAPGGAIVLGTAASSVKKVQGVLEKGREARSSEGDAAEANASYRFGDFTRGLLESGRQARGAEAEDSYRFGDFSRGLLTAAGLRGSSQSSERGSADEQPGHAETGGKERRAWWFFKSRRKGDSGRQKNEAPESAPSQTAGEQC